MEVEWGANLTMSVAVCKSHRSHVCIVEGSATPQRTCSTDLSSLAERFLLPLYSGSVAGGLWSNLESK